MKTTYKSRVLGSVVVLMVLIGLAIVVLHRKQPLPTGLAANDQTHQVLSLPLINEKAHTAWHARQSQQIDQARLAVNDQPKPVPSPVVATQTPPKPVPRPVVATHAAPPGHPVILQVASFSSVHNARMMRDNLRAAGYAPRIHPVKVHNKTWYRLSAGPFASAKQAHQVQQVIQQKWHLKTQLKQLH